MEVASNSRVAQKNKYWPAKANDFLLNLGVESGSALTGLCLFEHNWRSTQGAWEGGASVPNKWNMRAIKHRLSPYQIRLMCELFMSPVTFQARPRYINEHRTLANLRKRGVIARRKNLMRLTKRGERLAKYLLMTAAN